MVILLILIPGLLPTLRAKRTTRCKWSILPDSALHVQLLMQEHYGACSWIFRAFSVSAVALRAYSFQMSRLAETVPRDLSPGKRAEKPYVIRMKFQLRLKSEVTWVEKCTWACAMVCFQ